MILQRSIEFDHGLLRNILKIRCHSRLLKLLLLLAIKDAVLFFSASFLWGVFGCYESKNYVVNGIIANSFE